MASDAHQPERESSWFDDDALWADLAPSIFDVHQMTGAPQEAAQAAALAGVAPEAHILDMPCGIGRHSVALARLGYRVTGVDRNPQYLARAAEAARAANVDHYIKWAHDDMRTFARAGVFDAAINLYTSIGYGSRDDDRAILANFAASLRPGGALVIDTMGREVIARQFRERDYWKGGGEMEMVEEREVIGAWEMIRSTRRLIMPGGDGRLSRPYVFEVHPYAGDELAAELCRAGFAGVEVYGSLAGTRYDHLAKRLVVVGRKG